MSPEVYSALRELDRLVASDPMIEVSATGIAMPAPSRAAFYAQAAQTRQALASAVVGTMPDSSVQISHELKVIRAELMEMLCLDSLKLPVALEEFCEDPLLATTRTMTDGILSYVQGRITGEELFKQAKATVPAHLRTLSITAYETWLAYASVVLMMPTSAWRPFTPDDKSVMLAPARSVELGYQDRSVMMRMPELVFECEAGVFGLKVEVKGEIDFYVSAPQRRRDFSAGGSTSGALGRRYILLYRFANLDSDFLVAERDKHMLMRPEVMIGTFIEDDFAKPMAIAQTLRHVEQLKPHLQAHFVAGGDALEEARALTGQDGLPPFVVDDIGFDRRRLALWLPAKEKE
jgi:hypothetical protein